MKKALLLVVALMLCFALVACGNNDTQVDNPDVVVPPVDDIDTPVTPDLDDDFDVQDSDEVSGELEITDDFSGEIVPVDDSGEVSGELIAE